MQDEKAGHEEKFAEELTRMVNKMNQAQVRARAKPEEIVT